MRVGWLLVSPARDTLRAMTAAATKVPFADASPAEIRAAILPEEQGDFDASLREALNAVAETLSLVPLEECLASWRLTAWAQTAKGHDAYRDMLTRAERILATGQPTPGSRPWGEVRAELGL